MKPERELLLAYDDPLGLTAAFNKNLLLRMNTELDADFELDRFAHRAVWNREASRVEMHLVSLAAQDVDVADADLRFRLERRRDNLDRELVQVRTRKASVSSSNPRASFSGISGLTKRARFALTLFAAV